MGYDFFVLGVIVTATIRLLFDSKRIFQTFVVCFGMDSKMFKERPLRDPGF